MPNFKQMVTSGTAYWNLEAGGHYHTDLQQPTITGPGWSSVVSGVFFNKHGVYDNDTFVVDRKHYLYPHFFKHIREMYPDAWLGSVCDASTPNTVLLNSEIGIANLVYTPTAQEKTDGVADDKVREQAVSVLQTENPDALFVHFLDADHAGHTYGYGKTVPQYMATLASIDVNIGKILTAMRARPQFAQEKWLVAFTADHGGGLNKSHGSQSDDDRHIFGIFNGVGFSGGRVDNAKVYQSIFPHTLLRFLGIGINPQWGMEDGPATSIPDYPPAKNGVSIVNPRRNIRYPKPGDKITLTVDVQSVDPLASVKCYFSNNGSAFFALRMTNVGGTEYQLELDPLPNGSRVKYYFEAATATQSTKMPLALAPLPFYTLRVDDVPVDGTDLVINEVMYNPQGADNSTNSEWMEIYNRRTSPVDASFFLVADTHTAPEDFVIPEGTIVPANGYLIIAWDKAMFLNKYPALASNPNVVVVDSLRAYGLNNDADSPCISHPNDYQWNHLPTECYDVVPYTTTSPEWPAGAPDGYSLELVNPAADNALGQNWRLSASQNGTPGAQNSAFTPGAVHVESVTRNIENPTPTDSVVITARVAADGPATVKMNLGYGPSNFTLAMPAAGNNTYTGVVGMVASGTLISYSVTANAGSASYTWPYGDPVVPVRFRSLANPVLPGDLVINELQYDPKGTDGGTVAEWFEIYNNTPREQDLSYFTYRTRRDGEFQLIPDGTKIPPYGYLVVAGSTTLFNSDNPGFSSTGAGFLDAGWGLNAMTNSSNSLIEVRLTSLNALPTSKWGWPNEVDKVQYRATNYPWPGEDKAVNTGYTYELLHPSLDNNDGANWRLSKSVKGTPGKKNSVNLTPSAVADWSVY